MRHHSATRRNARLLWVVVVSLTAACSPGDGIGQRHGVGMMSGGMPMMMRGAPADTGAAPRPIAAPADAVGGCPAVSQPLVDRGRQVFGATGNCFACHGPSATGTAAAPNLTDNQWLNIDGSYPSVIGLVRNGVPHPKKYPAPMPPMGGAALTQDQVCAVSAYVSSLHHE